MTVMEKITGQYGDIFTVDNSASVTATGEAFGAITTLPGGSETQPVRKYYKVTDRAKKIADPTQAFTLKNGAAVVSPTLYTVHWGAGIVEYYNTFPGSSDVITADYKYIDTSGAKSARVASCRDWQLSMDAPDVDFSEYGSGFAAHGTGMPTGTFQFEKMEVDTDLFYRFRSAKLQLFAFYEDLRAPREWVVFGRIRQYPMSAPVGGVIAGTIQGTVEYWPDFLAEALALS